VIIVISVSPTLIHLWLLHALINKDAAAIKILIIIILHVAPVVHIGGYGPLLQSL